ncbi:MAG: alpha/beta fold hydrolase [Desulfuromonadales bacterium]|nr:alpha/beta fold hydrolase [Desulfuromonadales bacterium]
MLKQLNWIVGVCVCLLMLSSSLALAYDYPFDNPYIATVLNTPAEFTYDLPRETPVKIDTIKMFPEREIPGILWNFDELRYSYIRQKGPAPLIFLVAGTGASFHSAKMQIMQKAFYQAGYHVISLSSPTHPNFIVAASTSGVPGHLVEDSADLYRVMQAIWQKLSKKMEVTEFFLSGYSLGAAESAFIAKLDEQEKAFNFRKVLLINPPVSLYNSVLILDEMLEHNIPGGNDNFNAFYQSLIKGLTEVYVHGDDIEFNDQFLYQVYRYRKPKSDKKVAALIGVDFRISSRNMVFVSDVLTKAGYAVPKGLELGRHDNATDYLKVTSRLSFIDYFEGLFLPHFRAKDPNISERDLTRQMSLRYIEYYLRTSPKFGLIHNEDDIILLPGEIDYLRDLFGSRAQIFPHGGHCGNMAYPDNVTAMLDFFKAVNKNSGGYDNDNR